MAWCIHRFGDRFAILKMYERAPGTLTQEVAECLIELGCILPKFWIETIFQDQGHDPHRLPEGTLELLIAHGFQKYDDELHLVVPFVDSHPAEGMIHFIEVLFLALNTKANRRDHKSSESE
jgi:hypothetical protein